MNGRRNYGSPLFVIDYGVNIGVGGVGGDCGLIKSGDDGLAISKEITMSCLLTKTSMKIRMKFYKLK
jgi:hypothetical protein